MGKKELSRLLTSLLEAGCSVIPELEAKALLAAWGLPVVPCHLAKHPEDAVAAAEQLGYPVVMKVHSPAIVHKSDVGGVKMNIQSAAAVAQAFEDIAAACRPIDPGCGVVVEAMVKPGLEVIIGVSQDPQFGPTLLFGLGGVFVELFEDAAFRLIPVTHADAREMIAATRAFPLLKGYRGKPGGDVAFLADMIVSLSNLVDAFPAIREVDINPVIVYPQGALIADARMVLQPDPPSHAS